MNFGSLLLTVSFVVSEGLLGGIFAHKSSRVTCCNHVTDSQGFAGHN
jgi:hypothetical protein